MQAHGFHELVRRAQAGDEPAIAELLSRVRPWLEQLARGAAEPGHASASASDLAQDAWLRLWRKLDQFRGAGDDEQTLAAFRVWASRIVRRQGLNAHRRRAVQHRKPPGKLQRLTTEAGDSSGPGVPDPAGKEPTPSVQAEADERARMVDAALARVADDTDRAILRLRFFDGLSLRQVAERLGINHETARQRYHAALRHLEHELKGLL